MHVLNDAQLLTEEFDVEGTEQRLLDDSEKRKLLQGSQELDNCP